MVRGLPTDDDCKPLTFIEAAKIVGVAPDVARRWLDRAEVRQFLRAERRAFREAICCANEAALARVRDKSANRLAVVRSVQALEQLDQAHAARDTRAGPVAAGFVIVLKQENAPPKVIDAQPVPEPAIDAPAPQPPPMVRAARRRVG
jgi:hypothetical protein